MSPASPARNSPFAAVRAFCTPSFTVSLVSDDVKILHRRIHRRDGPIELAADGVRGRAPEEFDGERREFAAGDALVVEGIRADAMEVEHGREWVWVIPRAPGVLPPDGGSPLRFRLAIARYSTGCHIAAREKSKDFHGLDFQPQKNRKVIPRSRECHAQNQAGIPRRRETHTQNTGGILRHREAPTQNSGGVSRRREAHSQNSGGVSRRREAHSQNSGGASRRREAHPQNSGGASRRREAHPQNSGGVLATPRGSPPKLRRCLATPRGSPPKLRRCLATSRGSPPKRWINFDTPRRPHEKAPFRPLLPATPPEIPTPWTDTLRRVPIPSPPRPHPRPIPARACHALCWRMKAILEGGPKALYKPAQPWVSRGSSPDTPARCGWNSASRAKCAAPHREVSACLPHLWAKRFRAWLPFAAQPPPTATVLDETHFRLLLVRRF